MRVLFLNGQCLLFGVLAVMLTVNILSISAVPAKEHHKKKLLEKLRNSLNQTELEEAGDVVLEGAAALENGDAAVEAKTVEGDANEKVTSSSSSSAAAAAAATDSDDEEEEVSDKKVSSSSSSSSEDKKADEKESSTDLQKQDGPASYLLKMRSVLKRLFDMFGFRQSKKKEGRQNRMLSSDDSYSYNGLEYEYFSKDDIRTTVGAVLGEQECIQKIVCGAGSYLRDLNGKHVILTILENVTPSGWVDTMETLKKSAVTDGDCVYKCLESSAPAPSSSDDDLL